MIMLFVFVFVFGLLIGSFLNVCIARLPEGLSISTPPSHCPRCKKPIRFYDNIPIISFFILRKKCRSCGLPISWRYPFVELLNGLVYIWVLVEFGLNPEAMLVMAFCSALIVITFIDYDHKIIPDAITLPGMLLGLVIAPIFMSSLTGPLPFFLDHILPQGWPYLRSFLHSLIGLLLGGGPLLLIGWTWEKIRKVEAMGGGDVKLMGMVGAFLGWKGAFLTILLGALSGSIVGVSLILMKKQEVDKVIPFGPFLAFGAAIALFYGPEVLSWYLGLLRV